jgi:hypothetical protein
MLGCNLCPCVALRCSSTFLPVVLCRTGRASSALASRLPPARTNPLSTKYIRNETCIRTPCTTRIIPTLSMYPSTHSPHPRHRRQRPVGPHSAARLVLLLARRCAARDGVDNKGFWKGEECRMGLGVASGVCEPCIGRSTARGAGLGRRWDCCGNGRSACVLWSVYKIGGVL